MSNIIPIEQGIVFPSRFYEDQMRGIETVDIDDATGEVLLRAVTYNHWTQLADTLFESFAPASLSRATAAPGRVKMAMNHGGMLIGHAKEIEDRADGLYARMAFSKTATAQEARELVLDGTIDECSMVFRPQRDFMSVTRSAEGLRVLHKRAHLMSVDLVPHGQYGSASQVVSARDLDSDRAREAAIARLKSLNS